MGENVLFELGVEEVPHEVLTETLVQFKEKILEKLSSEGIVYKKINVYGTPRRLAVLLTEVEDKTLEKSVEKKGPSLKAAYDENRNPTKALQGFLTSNQSGADNLVIRDISGTPYVFIEKKEGGKYVVDVLPEIYKNIVRSISFPKTMKWGSGKMNFVRPIRWITALYGNDNLPFELEGIVSGNMTFGHRLLSGGRFTINNSLKYIDIVRENKIIVDQEERKKIILEIVGNVSQQVKAKPVLDDSLLDTLVNLTEYPNAALGSFDEEILKLPKEVLVSEMIENQKYIPLEDENGNLINKFIIIANTIPNNTIIMGNERVIRARFSDGKFFFDEDRKKKLEEYIPGLKNVLYAKGLGTMFDKVNRLQQITAILSELIGYNDALSLALRTALLCKADLVTGMVREFPELQGIIGYYYALNSSENINVAVSIKEHYRPKFSGDQLPSLKEGLLVSLADRFDNLFAMYAKGNTVTGSKDPYGLRRQTLGIIRILIDKKINLDLNVLMNKILPLYEGFISNGKEEFENKVSDFMTSRIKTVLKEYKFNFDEIEAGITSNVPDIFDSYLRIGAIHTARMSEDFIDLAIAFKRVKNIIKGAGVFAFREDILKEPAEKSLFKAYLENKIVFEDSLLKKDYKLSVSILTSFKHPVDKFFDDVLVMDKDEVLKNNRISLLAMIDQLFMKFIDFEKIVVE